MRVAFALVEVKMGAFSQQRRSKMVNKRARLGMIFVFPFLFAGCREVAQPKPPATTQQAPPPPSPVRPPASPPSVPGEPYHVHVRASPTVQPRSEWLWIERLAPGAEVATAEGRWIEPNIIEISTRGAAVIGFDLRRLPVRSGRSLVLRLDRQGIELSASLGPVVRFESGRAGVWSRIRQ